MEPKYEYASELNLYQANYMRNSKAIGVLWAVFTICFAIINVVVFIQPHWLGDTKESRGTGHFGLWQYCHLIQDGQDVTCQGRLDDFSSIPSAAFRAATVFVGLSVVMVLLCICCMLLFFVFHSSTVFHICGWMQVFCVRSSLLRTCETKNSKKTETGKRIHVRREKRAKQEGPSEAGMVHLVIGRNVVFR
ncbi:hypothetical protein HPB51_002430 [Rhipicephalus microplus]|uniref:Uncharacterized protein n=1 Tax=Rhipicephalus microplus TaxID=6941 RepID=A0A9J6DEV5_RHIMP|nr:hypothetical protein HPB51_002430 [Rhipicephalus microplus]